MKRYFGLDLGTKTLGVSISETGVIARSFKTIRFEEENYVKAVELLLTEVKENKIDIIILGYPKHMNNDIGIRGKVSEDFKNLINQQSNVEVILWDERLSTKTALRILSDNKRKKEKQRALKDEMAATVILQSYLDYKGV
ncbi:MAG: Holliday junction resolvase RuvX [Candidatus Phytoplasma sp.]|nr:Holliday junction resolvase RuvX [Phytoplasma sp.]